MTLTILVLLYIPLFFSLPNMGVGWGRGGALLSCPISTHSFPLFFEKATSQVHLASLSFLPSSSLPSLPYPSFPHGFPVLLSSIFSSSSPLFPPLSSLIIPSSISPPSQIGVFGRQFPPSQISAPGAVPVRPRFLLSSLFISLGLCLCLCPSRSSLSSICHCLALSLCFFLFFV